MPDDPDVPTVTPPPCAMNYTVQEDTASGGAIRVFTPGSVLNVSCSNTPGVTDSGVREFDLREKRTGGQRPREVSFVVTCAYNTVPARGTLTCGSGSNTMVLARARVRYDIDLSIVPKRPDCGPYSDAAELPVNWDSFTDNLCTASSVRAVVPKIVQWSIKGG